MCSQVFFYFPFLGLHLLLIPQPLFQQLMNFSFRLDSFALLATVLQL